MKALFVLLGLFALAGAGCEDTPATGGHTTSRTSYPTDPEQPVYTGPQEYRPESYPDPQYPYSPAQNQLPGLQPVPPPSN
jgi:hypothetical protein